MDANQVYRSAGEIDIQQIRQLESKTGFRFPEKYKTLLSSHNFLAPENSDFRFLRDGKIEERDINFYGFGDKDSTSRSSKVGEHFFEEERVPKGILPFGDCGNGDHVCFDYRHDANTDEPRVVIMLHDAYDNNNKMFICPVTNSFEEFMDSLYKYEG